MRRFGAAIGLALIFSASLPAGANAASIERTYPVGNEPFGVTIDPADGRIYVANSDHGSNSPGVLSVVDPTTPQCTPISCGVKSIALGSPPSMSALDRGLRRLYVTTADRGLTFVDLATQSVVRTIPGAGALGVAVDEATHHVYAAAVSSLSMVDGVTGEVLHTALAGPGDSWWAVALDASAGRVYVTNLDQAAPSLVVLAASDLSMISEVPLPDVPRLALAVDTARQVVYVSGYSAAGRLYVVDAATLQVTRSVDLGAGNSWPITATLVAPEDRLYVSQTDSQFGANSIGVLDLATLGIVQRISLPWWPGQSALHANGRLYVAGFGADLLASVNLANSAPVIDSVTLSPSAPHTNDVLQSTVVARDADGDGLTYGYEWLRNGQLIPGASGPSLDLSVAGHGDRGDSITVRVTASDGQTTSAFLTSSVIVANSAPTTTSVVLSPSAPSTNQVITATAASSDADGNALTWTFTWTVNGVVRSTTTGAKSSASFDLALAGNGDKGQTVTVDVVVSDGALEGGTVSASAVVANSAPVVSVSVSDGTPKTNAILRATAVGQDADNDSLTYTFTWRVNGAVRRTLTTASVTDSFDLGVKGNGDNGDLVSVTVAASDGSAVSSPASASALVTAGNH